MLDQGNKAHSAYQKTPGNCDVSEFAMKAGRADCIVANAPVCTVIELKPDNRRAIAIGKQKGRRYVRELHARGPAFKKLVAQDSAFADCDSFTNRVHCYTLCPEIDENGEFVEAKPVWREDCR
jgi:hypothetical protein